MPESRKRKIDGKPVDRVTEKKTKLDPHWTDGIKPTPTWWAPVFCTLAVIGLIWLAIYYMWSAQYPIPGIGHWVQQEAPAETNAALAAFVDSLA